MQLRPTKRMASYRRSQRSNKIKVVKKKPNHQNPMRETNDHPPQLNEYEITHGVTLRFTCTAAVVNQVITFENLLDSILIATTATAAFDLFDLVRIRRISIWGQAALGTPSTVAVTFLTPTGDGDVHSDTSLGIKPAYVAARPSKRSLASFFNVAIGAVFNITCPAGSIIDMHLSFRTTTAAPTATQNPVVAAVPGEVYWRGLDGLAIATTNFPPPAGIPSR